MRKIILLLVCWFGFFCSAIACTPAQDPLAQDFDSVKFCKTDFPAAAKCYCLSHAPLPILCKNMNAIYNNMMLAYKHSLEKACEGAEKRDKVSKSLCYRQWVYYRTRCPD